MKIWHAILGAAIATSTSLSMVASAETLTLDPLTIQNPLENVSSAGLTIPVTPIDPRFRITRLVRPGASLAQNSLLVTAVNEMSKLALRDWNGRVQSFRSERVAGYTDVSIVIRTVPPAQPVLTRVAVWGFYAAIDNMRITHNFAVNEYQLYWDGSIVGILRFNTASNSASQPTSSGGGGPGGNESGSLEDEMLPTLPTVATPFHNLTNVSPYSANITGTLQDDTFLADCHFVRDAQPLSFEEVFLPLICALRDIAAVPRTSVLDARFVVQPVGIDSKVLFGGRRYGPISSQDTYQYQWAIETLNVIPRFLLMQNRFAEVYVNIIVNGNYLGVGGLDKRDLGGGVDSAVL